MILFGVKYIVQTVFILFVLRIGGRMHLSRAKIEESVLPWFVQTAAVQHLLYIWHINQIFAFRREKLECHVRRKKFRYIIAILNGFQSE